MTITFGRMDIALAVDLINGQRADAENVVRIDREGTRSSLLRLVPLSKNNMS